MFVYSLWALFEHWLNKESCSCKYKNIIIEFEIMFHLSVVFQNSKYNGVYWNQQISKNQKISMILIYSIDNER